MKIDTTGITLGHQSKNNVKLEDLTVEGLERMLDFAAECHERDLDAAEPDDDNRHLDERTVRLNAARMLFDLGDHKIALLALIAFWDEA